MEEELKKESVTESPDAVLQYKNAIIHLLERDSDNSILTAEKIQIPTHRFFNHYTRVIGEKYINLGIVSLNFVLALYSKEVIPALKEMAEDPTYDPNSNEAVLLRSLPIVQQLDRTITAYTAKMEKDSKN